MFIVRMIRNINSQARNPQEADGLLSEPEDGGDMFLRNVGLSELHGVATQKIVILIYIYVYRPTMTVMFPKMLLEGQWFMRCLSAQARATTGDTQSNS
jgi:hypothetical protein